VSAALQGSVPADSSAAPASGGSAAFPSPIPAGGVAGLADGGLAVLVAVAWLAVPVSIWAGILQLELAGTLLVLSADGYWTALALASLLCARRTPGGRRAWFRGPGSEPADRGG